MRYVANYMFDTEISCYSSNLKLYQLEFQIYTCYPYQWTNRYRTLTEKLFTHNIDLSW